MSILQIPRPIWPFSDIVTTQLLGVLCHTDWLTRRTGAGPGLCEARRAGRSRSSRGLRWGWGSIGSVAALSAVLFVLRQKGTDDALMPLTMFRDRAFSASLGIASAMTFGMYAMLCEMVAEMRKADPFEPPALISQESVVCGATTPGSRG
jgi:hypothetical protein